MKTLAEIYKRVCVDAGYFCDRNTTHSYLDVYESLLAPYRDTAKRVLEIGIYDGGGLLMWEEYFKSAIVHGIDCSITPLDKVNLRPLIECKHHICIFDATNQDQVAEFTQDGIKLDVIFDDAAHTLNQQLKLFELWWPHLAPGGIYIVEDIQGIDKDRHEFESRGFVIIDLRSVKNRYDDVLAIKRK